MPILRQCAERRPDKIAARIAFSDETITYSDLDRRTSAVTQLLVWMGLSAGDVVAVMLDNDLTYFEIILGSRRHGVYYTPISTHLTPEEAAYIVRDSGANIGTSTVTGIQRNRDAKFALGPPWQALRESSTC